MQQLEPIDPAMEERLRRYYQNHYQVTEDPQRVLVRLAPVFQTAARTQQRTHSARATAILSVVAKPKRPVRYAIAALFACFFILAGTAYAGVFPALNQLLTVIGGPAHVPYTSYNQSQSIDGYTFTLRQAYADSNRVQVGIDVKLPDAGSNAVEQMLSKFKAFNQVTLKAGDNITLPDIRAAIGDARGDQSGIVFIFDASAFQGSSKNLPLTLTIADRENHTFTFTATVPFEVGRTLTLHQSVTVNGETFILDRVVITPSAARVYLEGVQGPDLKVSLTSASTGKMYEISTGVLRGTSSMLDFDPSGFKQSDTWTLTLQKMGQNGETWIFHFTA